MDDDLWAIEQRLWTQGVAEFRERMAPGCVMVFPGIGILGGEHILDSLKGAPRWTAVAMTGRHHVSTDNVAVLAYAAQAERGGAPAYRALCSSVWLRRADGWRIVQHQQSASE